MKTWITSDLHFGHTNIMKFCPQSRAHYNGDVAYMNETMITEWNQDVGPKDTVYILGDVAFCNAADATKIVRRLNGRKILVEGNHDRKALKDPVFRSCFAEVHKYLDINYNGNKIVMFHYPIAEHDQCHRGSIHFHGHLHGNPSGVTGRVMDVGMDATGKIVTLMEDAIAEMLKREPRQHH